jgi:prevent-host-death family protein
METVSISHFKARCLAILARVKRTGRPVLVTRFGEPVAEVVPPTASTRPRHWLGSMKGTARIVGDIVAPASDEKDWEVLRK